LNGTLAQALKGGTLDINRFAGEDVTYCRLGREVTVRMRPTDATYPAKIDSTLTEQWSGKNWVVAVDEWESTQLTTPARGDKILRSVDFGSETYELVAPPGMQMYDYTTFRDAILIHSQLVPTT